MQSRDWWILQISHILRGFVTSSLKVQNDKVGPFFIARPEGSEFPGDSANDTFAAPGMVSDAVTNWWNGELKAAWWVRKSRQPISRTGTCFLKSHTSQANCRGYRCLYLRLNFVFIETLSSWGCLNILSWDYSSSTGMGKEAAPGPSPQRVPCSG